jgi:methyl-accepting chemotaxis protein
MTSWTQRVANWRSQSRTREARSVLRNIQRDLGGVSSSTEGLFLLVGERLMDLQVRAREIASQTTAIAELLSNDAGSLVVLDEVLSATCASRDGNGIAAAIEGIQESAKSIHQAIQAIGPVVKTFDVLGVLTRIESAHLEGAGATFVGLADAVVLLSQQVREQIGATAESATVLLETTSQASEELRQVAQKHRETLGPLASQTSLELHKIRDHHNLVSDATKRLAARFDGVSQAVGDVVTALQAHDIVRQQVEHVLEALGRLGRADSNLAETARLQAAQLNNSRITFESSVGQIRDALVQIERNIGEVVEEAARLLGLSGSGGGSFLSSVASDLAGILTILDSNQVADQRLAEAAVSVRQRIAGISQTIAGVGSIGIQMQRVALNATIQAARLGPEGAAIEIVAQAIQVLARETETASGTLEDRLRTIRDAVAALETSTAARGGSEAQTAHLRRSAEALSSMQDKARGGYARAVDLTAGLKQEIRETIETFGRQDECLRVLAAATEMLRELSSDAPLRDPAGVELTASSYTMQSERGVHHALYETVPQDRPFPQESALPASQEDNVEFF